MPSKSKSQHNLMAAVANNPKFAKKVGIPKSVGKDFMEADKGKRFGTGGDVGYTYGGKNQINKQRTRFGSKFGYKLNVPNENLNKYIGKKEGGVMKDTKAMKKGGYAAGGRMAAKGEHPVQKQSKRGAMMVKMAAGGLAAGHKSADGVAKKGKTKAKHVAMRMGGKTC